MTCPNAPFITARGSRRLLAFAAALALAACGGDDQAPAAGAESPPPELEPAQAEAALAARARGIHERVLTVDTHVDIDTANFTAQRNYTMPLDTQVTLPAMEEGGLDVAWFIVYTRQDNLDDAGYAAAYANAIDKFDAIERLATTFAPERIGLAYSSAEARRIAASGRKVAMIGVENAYPMGLDLERIAEFHARGARYMSLAHNGHNQLADSHTGEADGQWRHDGLSELGYAAIAEMNRLGIMIDVSHLAPRAIAAMLEASEAPLMASHSSARAVSEHSRNLSDDQLRAIAAGGGVVQTVALDAYLNAAKHARHTARRQALHEEVAAAMGLELLDATARAALDEAAAAAYDAALAELQLRAAPRLEAEVNAVAPPVDVGDLADHIDYMVGLIGIDHVGISSDFDGGGGIAGWRDASETFNVTLELVRRGYSEDDIARLWGGNLLRVLDEVQAVAARLQATGD